MDKQHGKTETLFIFSEECSVVGFLKALVTFLFI
jgi:hypothetical protein